MAQWHEKQKPKHIDVKDETPESHFFTVRRIVATGGAVLALAGAVKGADYIGDKVEKQQEIVRDLNQPTIDAIEQTVRDNEHRQAGEALKNQQP